MCDDGKGNSKSQRWRNKRLFENREIAANEADNDSSTSDDEFQIPHGILLRRQQTRAESSGGNVRSSFEIIIALKQR